MDTRTHISEPSEAVLLAYGREVETLLSSSTPERWRMHVWDMFGGYILAQKDLGYTPELSNTFWSFKELVEFFEVVERVRDGNMVG
ncbi:hypothetical protein DYBT9623_02759 [Dyadobacter sp. CECT 9623]|uniref:Uncharacterized protein n=1 Tax=Dyadobacter linearis TaxID=2823330 RepID=A0ABM8UR59_9BACT|nr:hypothetical protein [Dyadobacter sp. CECT 9623]CAG5070019.1 hypothetical protein DYBT9623_02759 [Dyadobacter sp. CECT 9623]